MDKEKIIELLNFRIKNPDLYYTQGPGAEMEYWKKLANELKKGSMDEIINCLDSLSDKQLEYAQEVFEDIYDDLDENDKFFDKLIKLKKRHPTADLGQVY